MNIDINFQTPLWCCSYMVSLVPPGVKSVLEPTPGIGNLVNELKKKYNVIAPLNFWDIDGNFDCIVMNPPFTPMKIGYDILYKCMDMSDRIIALMPWLTIINSEKRTNDIFKFGLKSVTHLSRNTFPGTRVQCCILNMDKTFVGQTIFEAINNKNEIINKNINE